MRGHKDHKSLKFNSTSLSPVCPEPHIEKANASKVFNFQQLFLIVPRLCSHPLGLWNKRFRFVCLFVFIFGLMEPATAAMQFGQLLTHLDTTQQMINNSLKDNNTLLSQVGSSNIVC